MEFYNINAALIKAEIISLSEGRFINEGEGLLGSILDEITPESLNDKAILSLKRDWSNPAGKRTLLIAVIDSQDQIKISLQWAEAVKDELTEPENGNVYLFIAVKNEQLSLDQCTDIEASDRICRRYVLRQGETIREYLSRSFIAPVISNTTTDGISDPLNVALEKTSERQAWFNTKEQHIWREALLSDKSATEIIKSLFKS